MSALAKFDFTMPLTKVEKTDDGRLLFEGIASTTLPDKQKERMSDHAIEKMAQAEPVLLYPTHQRLAGTELGKTIEHSIRGGELFIKGELFPWVEEAARIYKLASEGLAEYEFSVGGDIVAAYNEFNKTTNTRVRVLDELALNHVVIASAGKAACPGTWMEVVGKTLDGVQLDEHEEGAAPVAQCEKTELIRELFAKAKAGLADTFGKAGAKHTGAERKAIHGMIEGLHRLCDCTDCTALIDELDGSVEVDAEAGKSTSFSDNLTAREARSDGWYAADVLLWDLTDILSSTVAEIAGQAEVDVPAKVAMIELALGEFTAAVMERLAAAEGTAAKTTDEGRETPTVTLQEKKDRKAALEAELAQLDAEITTEEAPPADPPAEEAPPADPPAEEQPPADPPADPPAGDPPADPPAADPPAEEAGKTIADLTAQVERLTGEVAKLSGKPVGGGPASTAAGETFNKTDDEPPTEDVFEKTVEQVEQARGTAAGHAAQRQANDLVAGSVMRQLGVRPQFAEGDQKGE